MIRCSRPSEMRKATSNKNIAHWFLAGVKRCHVNLLYNMMEADRGVTLLSIMDVLAQDRRDMDGRFPKTMDQIL